MWTKGPISGLDYPYVSANGTVGRCRHNDYTGKFLIRPGMVHQTQYEPTFETVKAALQYGPVLAGVPVYDDLYSYSSGVYNSDLCTPGDAMGHFMTAVGYGPDHILFKNSWGAEWGEDGYIRWAPNPDCNIFDYVWIPMVGIGYPDVPGAPEPTDESVYPDYCDVPMSEKPAECFLPEYCYTLEEAEETPIECDISNY